MSLTTVTVGSRFTPPLTIDVASIGQGGGEADGDSAAKLAKVYVRWGAVTYAPGGEPGDEWVLWVGGALVALALVLARIVR